MNQLIESTTGVVLAGGMSRRMGSDKAWVELHGIPLIARVASRLKEVFARILIVAAPDPRFASLGFPVLADEVPGIGPIGGLQTALKHGERESAFVVGCDMPFLDVDLIRGMAFLADDADAIVPQIDGRLQPLHAVYRRRILPVVEAQAQSGDFSLQRLLRKLRVRIPNESIATEAERWQRSCLSLNTPEELEKARRELSAIPPQSDPG